MTAHADDAELRHHERVDPHVRGRWLTDVVLGAQDGLVNTLGVVLGVDAASADPRIVVASGLAAALAESVSMAAVAYTTSRSRAQLFQSERAREYRHVAAVPRLERDEIRAIYARKGFEGALLDRVVDTICANADVWVEEMMRDEHGLADEPRRASLRSAAIVGASSLVASVAPVVPFVWLGATGGAIAAFAAGAALLFALGALAAHLTARPRTRGGAALVAIGLASAAVAYAIGRVLGVGP